jgi:CTP:molybdopterin cytidylyltransferase MocA
MAKIGAVLWAAGSSARFGAENKLLAEISDRPSFDWSPKIFVKPTISQRS